MRSLRSKTSMSYTWEYLQDNPKETQRLIGISFEQLIQLIEQGKIAHEQKQAELGSHEKAMFYSCLGVSYRV